MSYSPDIPQLALVEFTNVFSFVGTSVILYRIIKKPEIFRLAYVKLVFSLILADFFCSIWTFTQIFTYLVPSLCIISGFLTQFCYFSAIMWSVCISHYCRNLIFNDKERFKTYLYLSTVLPFLSSFGTVFGNLTSLYPGYIFQDIACVPDDVTIMITAALPANLLLVYAIYQIVQYRRMINTLKLENTAKSDGLLIYPMTIVLVLIPGLITKGWEIIEPQTSPYYLVVLFKLSANSLGIVNSLSFGIQNRELLKKGNPQGRNLELNLVDEAQRSRGNTNEML